MLAVDLPHAPSLFTLHKDQLNNIEAEALSLAQEGKDVMMHATKHAQAPLVWLISILDRLESEPPLPTSSTY